MEIWYFLAIDTFASLVEFNLPQSLETSWKIHEISAVQPIRPAFVFDRGTIDWRDWRLFASRKEIMADSLGKIRQTDTSRLASSEGFHLCIRLPIWTHSHAHIILLRWPRKHAFSDKSFILEWQPLPVWPNKPLANQEGK